MLSSNLTTINPGAYLTGFNDTMAETAFLWMDDSKNFNKKAYAHDLFKAVLENQLDPQEMIDAMIEIIPADSGKFRNVVPKAAEYFLKTAESTSWEDLI